ncbi:ABC transporter permease [Oceanibaculum indicum]|uniref:Binding-protein-dependent transport system inner membrane protein n=1 Tax=Oceanibaculum indicum P24 TaxID=1207063 RepID=K2JVI7_9PROT|nr:ABC transporter permease subunit [Oceanibaculum indicum]EKE69180.1 binding-protein-dependent transport system inner membrane protein [Oceanibaculum indicum P24]
MLRLVPPLTLLLFLGPIAAGLAGTLLPAFGHLPVLGMDLAPSDPWRMLAGAPGLGTALTLTLTSGLLSAALSYTLAVGLCAAFHDRAWFARLRVTLAPLLAVPHAALAIGFAFLIAPSGWIARLISPWLTGWETPPGFATVADPYALALTMALMLKETPFLLLMILAALNQVPSNRLMAVSRTLGYGPITGWLKAVLPLVQRQIRLPLYAVLAYALSNVDMAIVLAPDTPPPLAVQLLRWFNDPDLAMRFPAAAGAVLLCLVVALAIGLTRGIEALTGALGRRWIAGGSRGGSGTGLRLAAGVGGGLALALSLFSLLALGLWSLAGRWRYPDALPQSIGLSTWMRQGETLALPFWTTLWAGLAATLIALALVLACLEHEQRRGRALSQRGLWLLYLPLLVPQVGFLFGVQVLLVVARLDGSAAALVWSHLLFVLPYVYLALADPYRALDARYERTARCLGASPARVFWRVKLPILLKPILIAAAIGFAVSVSQYLPTLFAGAGRYATLTTEAVSLSAGADRRVVAVFAFAQGGLPFLGFLLALLLPAWLYRHRAGLRRIG